eukprot:GGOE01000715.1.p1 GENE.GGOE01000715.1~~GGOE01000715.1.p1  ORF type:complete len:184 (+),score=34.94 GGOE01000715.1:54-605(+)
MMSTNDAADASTHGARCRREHAPGQQCTKEALPGSTYCQLHECPICKAEKPSTATACPACVDYAPNAVQQRVVSGGEKICAHRSDRGQCAGAPVANSEFCSLHSCPTCGMEKVSNAKGCASHLDAPATTAAKPPCAIHEWSDSNLDSIMKSCTFCNKKLVGFKAMKCKNCDLRCHKTCASGAH